MKIFKLQKVPLIIFLVLVFLPLITIISQNLLLFPIIPEDFSEILMFLLIIPALSIFYFISDILKDIGIDLGSVDLFPGGNDITVLGFIILVIIYILVMFVIAKIINLFFHT